MFEDQAISGGQEALSPRQKADLLRKAIELLAPDLKTFYPTVRKGRIEKVYTTDNSHFYCDVQTLNNDETVDTDKPVIYHVEIPVHFAGPDRGIICQPVEGLICDITFYDGDEDFPAISNFRYTNNKIPGNVHPGELLIQKGPNNYTKFCADGTRDEAIPGNHTKWIGRDRTESVGGSEKSSVYKSRTESTGGDHVIACKGRLGLKSEKGTVFNTSTLAVEAGDTVSLNAHGCFTAGGAVTNIVSEDSLNLMAAGASAQVTNGPAYQEADSVKQQLYNLSVPQVENVFELNALLGNYKINMMAGNFDIDIVTGLFNFANSANSLRKITEKTLDTINEAFTKINEVCDTISALTVGTGVGNSSTPLNASDFANIKADISNLQSALENDKSQLELFFK